MQNNKKPATGVSLKSILNDSKVPLSRYIHKRVVANDRNMPYLEKLKMMLNNNGKSDYQYNNNNRNRCSQAYTYTEAHTIHHGQMEDEGQLLNQEAKMDTEAHQHKKRNQILHKRAQSLMRSDSKQNTPRIQSIVSNKKAIGNLSNNKCNTSTTVNSSEMINNTSNPITTTDTGTNKSNKFGLSQRRVTDHELLNEIKTDLMRKRVISNNSANNKVNPIKVNNLSGNLNSYLNHYDNIHTNLNTSTHNIDIKNTNNRSKYEVINYNNKYFPLPTPLCTDAKENQFICAKWGKMELLTLLGSGANANVREGLCHGRKYAVKIYQKYKLLEPRKKKRVYTEIQLLKSLSEHPNIITMHQAFEDKREIHVIFEQVNTAITLSQHFRSNVLYIEESQVQKIFGRVVRGVHHIHSHGIAHRDIKPDNILISEDEDGEMIVKIIDFGFAINATSADLQCGTPNFMAPELLNKSVKYNPLPVDIWALGVMLFYLLEGRYPFKGYDQKDLYKSIKSGHFQFKKINQPEIIEIIESMLVVNPAGRATAEQLMLKQWILNF